jgi:hypothetical protein
MPTLTADRRGAARTSFLLGATAAAISLAACGSANNTATNAAASVNRGYTMALAYAKCVRTHGVPNFPDPSGNGNVGLRVQNNNGSMTVNGAAVSAPAFEAAQKACRAKLPNAGRPQPLSASRRQALINFSACMRAHGLPGFPDPIFNGGAVELRLNRGGGLDPNSPAFKSAQTACASITRQAGLGPGAGP